MNKEILIKKGINYSDGIHRFMNNRELYENTLRVFLSDTSIERACKALDEKNPKAFENAIYDLKGASATLSIESLYKLSSQIILMLDSNNTANAMVLFEALCYEYGLMKKAISDATWTA